MDAPAKISFVLPSYLESQSELEILPQNENKLVLPIILLVDTTLDP